MPKAASTRMDILSKAFPLVYQKGYQATSVDEIIALTSVTKGAFYYHFKNKDDMGLAMINEILSQPMGGDKVAPLNPAEPPKTQIYGMMKALLENEAFFKIEYGCPIVKMIEEMAPMDAKFAEALHKIYAEWKTAIVGYLDEAKNLNTIKNPLDSGQVADFVIMGYSGARNLGKILGKPSYDSYLKELKNYLVLLS